jgi:SAM-dependent methyltransferase
LDELIYDKLYREEDWHWWFRGRRAVIRSLIERAGVPASPRILDAGCGTGRNLIELGALGTTAGVDASAQAVEYCRRRGLEHVHRSSVESMPFEDSSFDLVLMADVLEHISDDHGALRELHRVCSPEGALVLTVPAYRWMWSQHDESHHHKRRYTRRELLDRLRAAGWSPQLATYFNSVLLPPIGLVRLLARRGKPRERGDTDLTPGALNSVLGLPMRMEAALIRAGVRFPAGVSIGAVCRPGHTPPGGQ